MLSYDSPVPIADKSAPVDMTNLPKSLNQASASGMTSTSADDAMSARDAPAKDAHHIWLVTGPAGVGKSSVGVFLADSLGYPYIEGDEVSAASHLAPPHT